MTIASEPTGDHDWPAQCGNLARWRELRRAVRVPELTWAAAGFWIVIFWVVVSFLAPILVGYPPNATLGKINEAPSLAHLMGTDQMGRDVLSRLLFGSQPILLLAPLAVLCASIVGITLGLVAGYFGGVIDDILMRLLDATMAFPTLLLYMIIIAALGPSRVNVVVAITDRRLSGRGAAGAQPGARRAQPRIRPGRALARRVVALHHVPRDPAQLPGPGRH